ncbi:MAG TPA: GTP cyclohydrolase II [Dongiaceae bacterium]
MGKLAMMEEPDAAALEAVDRAIGEIRRGRVILLRSPAGDVHLGAIETLDEHGLGALGASGELTLVLTAPRAAAIGLTGTAGEPLGAWHVSRAVIAKALRDIADPTALSVTQDPRDFRPAALAPELRIAAIELVKLARLLPAALISFELQSGRDDNLLAVGAAEVTGYQRLAARSLRPVGDARVPLTGAENARVIAFRPSDGGIEHLAVIVGEPPKDGPVLTRIHSECFTGDLLGSLRCDCGDQLRGAIAEIGRQGQGILLYLAQEGRGIGLVNKLRAYRLQDSGADTAEANRQLGFEADERIYLPAAEMLRQLGYHQVRLLTNNPAKVEGLRRCGVTVTERVPHVFPANGHNERYLAAKVAQLGHVM